MRTHSITVVERHIDRIYAARSSLHCLRQSIESEARNAGIDSRLLCGVLAIESAHRPSWVRFCEQLACTVWPSFIVRRDMSIGLGQIRPSTAKALLKDNGTDIALVKKLMNPKFNVFVCAQLLATQAKLVDYQRGSVAAAIRLAKVYTTGKKTGPNYPWIVLYGICLHRMVTALTRKTRR